MSEHPHKIAIIGLAGRFPGAESAVQFWDNLVSGRSGVSDVQLGNTPRGLSSEPNYVGRTSVIKDAEYFDAKFFGIYPKQAIDLDPQHRLFLEVCWHAMEDAGYVPDNTPGRVGVFAGCHMNTYILNRLVCDPDFRALFTNSFPGGGLNAEISNDKDYLATRVSYHLNLRGPSVTVQTACSTSLVAISQACESLLADSCDMALAGGVTVTFPQEQGYLHTEDSILSPDGTCRTFDAEAKGTIFGDGVGVVVLKRLEHAIKDRDDIYAVISGWGVNNDGGQKNGYTAPSVSGQSAAIRQAHKRAGVTADTISYVEAHGTGTLVGDPIEIQALTEAFRDTTDKKQFCRIGSLKSNVGHLDVAAGVAGVIKTCFSIKHRVLPPLLHFKSPNPRIDFQNSPFVVNDQLTPWQADTFPRRAGVSSFGVGGTNAHVVLEEANDLETKSSPRAYHIICLSARNSSSLDEMTADLALFMRDNPDLNLADVGYTLSVGRKLFSHKRSVVASCLEEAVESLQNPNAKQTFTSNSRLSNTPVVMMFPGQGSQHVNMARDLYHTESVFRDAIDSVAISLHQFLDLDIRDFIYGAEKDSGRLDQTELAQPALFAVSYSLGRWWQSLGVFPAMLIGHSVGEFAAAVLSGVMTLSDGARLVALRGRLMQSLPPGAMLSIQISETRLSQFLPDDLEIAAVNGPEFCVVSGPVDRIEAFANEVEAEKYGENIAIRRLRTSHAFHSRMMDPAIDAFEKEVRATELCEPSVPILSTVTARPLKADQAVDPAYWARQIREPVRFSDGIRAVLNQYQGGCVLLEAGPNQALCTLARQQELIPDVQFVVPSLPQAKQAGSDGLFVQQMLSRLWHCGVNVNWQSIYRNEDRRRLHLPTYRFQRECYSFNKTKEMSNPLLNETRLGYVTSSGDQSNHSVASSTPSNLNAHVVQQQMDLMQQQIGLLRKISSQTRQQPNP